MAVKLVEMKKDSCLASIPEEDVDRFKGDGWDVVKGTDAAAGSPNKAESKKPAKG